MLPHAYNLERRLGWEVILHTFIEVRRNKAFDWSDYNCAFFIADAVKAMTGVDLAKEYRGLLEDGDTIAAYKLLKEKGYETIEEVMQSLFEEIPVSFAQAGDVLLYPSGGPFEIEGLALCGWNEALVPGDIGLATLPKEDAKKAFKVARP